MAVFDTKIFPCFEYYGNRINDKEKAKACSINLIRAYKSCGVPDNTIRMILSMQYIYAKAGEDIDSLFMQERAEDGVDCRKYAEEHYSGSFDLPGANFCLACPICNVNLELCEKRDYGIVSRFVRLPFSEGVILLKDKTLRFSSAVSLNAAGIFGNKLEVPCVVEFAQMVYDALMDNEMSLYRRISGWKEGQSTDVVMELTQEVILLLGRVLGGLEKTFLHEKKACEVLCGYIVKNVFGAEPADDTYFDAFLNSSVNVEEEEEDVSLEMPDFAQELAELDSLAVSAVKGDEMPEHLEDEAEAFISAEEAHEANVEEFVGSSEQVKEDTADEEIAEPDEIEGKSVAESEGAISEEEDVEENSAIKVTGPKEEPLVNLDAYPYFHAKVEVTRGGWLSDADNIPFVPVSERRYRIPFAQNDVSSISLERNVILHHEVHSSVLEKMVDLTTDERAEKEMDVLQKKVRKDWCMAVEVVYVSDEERYILLLWNAATRRYNYVPLINKAEGKLKVIPYEVTQILKSEKRKIICYQPYLLCGISGLYDSKIETKNVHSIYSHYKVLTGDTSFMIEDILGSYFYAADGSLSKELAKYKDMYGSYSYLLTMMPFYKYIKEQQFLYADGMGKEGLCASRQKKDIMYGYSYLAAGVYPGRQGACFKLLPNNQIVFEKKMEPCISYVPGYIMEFTFANIESEEEDIKVEENVKNNQKAKRLLLKELARQKAAFYHGDLKLLYIDDYRIVFYVTHAYRAVHKTDITRILMHETYRYRIPSNQLLARFWGTGLNVVRYVNKH